MDKQLTQKEAYDKHSNVREFEAGELVMVRNYRDNHIAWLPGSIMKKLGQVTFVVILNTDSTSSLSSRYPKKNHKPPDRFT